MQAGLPVFACTDQNTDIGKVIVEGNFGWWCESNDVQAFGAIVQEAIAAPLQPMGKEAYRYLNAHYSAKEGYHIIVKHLGDGMISSAVDNMQ